jgi:hypothetical protein
MRPEPNGVFLTKLPLNEHLLPKAEFPEMQTPATMLFLLIFITSLQTSAPSVLDSMMNRNAPLYALLIAAFLTPTMLSRQMN